ncbi:MAG: hypothetical protein A2744_00670 [Candidatus Buchananbacteria bacterium RIFCSPHIGHO2_01_FULL_44_11]|uniref:Thioredoxin domain-containing protein n=1 Tax=Candidatus Buchananbacteria bacterium RIFCSPHIGHO2_01_FULL_44_11 TaxID=1797535 RepID=A0A1G1Y0R4_9BACT|nr:MAG: hypothetical protein A2744_00670 [Candidatus Buchananbacteria bacterium RIFCSPHIGHO2_01_FULL_44_11]
MYSSQDNNLFNQANPPFLSGRRLKWYRRWWGKALLIFLTLFLVVLVAWGFYVGRLTYLIRTGQIDSNQLLNRPSSSNNIRAETLPTQATADDPGVGPFDAKVVIVEFSDFQCPYCGQAFPVVQELIKNYGDQIRFVFRDFPLTDVHPRALPAALAAECAHEQGKFWPMHDKIFANQQNLEEADLKTYAIQVGLNSIQFGDCLQSQRYLGEVQEDLTAGIQAGVVATPTFFINGFKVEGAVPLSAFQQIIVAELNQ